MAAVDTPSPPTRTVADFLSTPLGYGVGIAVVAAAYVLTGRVGLLLPQFGLPITLIWPPTGIAVGSLFRFGLRLWPGVFLGVFLTLLPAGPWWVALGIAVGNTLGPVLAVVLLRKMQFDAALRHPQDLLVYVMGAGLGAMAVCATNGVFWLSAAGKLPGEFLAAGWLTWWLGDLAGVLLVGPAVLVCGRPCGRGRAQFAEAIVSIVAQVALAFLVFDPFGARRPGMPIGFLPLIGAVWIGLRYPAWVGALAALAMGTVAVWGTAIGNGPFGSPDLPTRLFIVWAYLCTVAIVTLALATLQAQRDYAIVRLAAAADEYRALVDDTPAMICRYTAEGTLTFANDTLCKFLGRSRPEVIGGSVREFLPTLPVPHETTELPAQQPEGLLSRIGPMQRADGAERWHRWTARPLLSAEGTLAGYHAVGVDITDRRRADEERRELERKLLETQRLESLGVLAGGIAHDFNNLLAGILGEAELASAAAPTGPVHEHLTQIIAGVRRAGGLTRQLLAYSGKGKFLVRPVDPGELVREMEALLRSSVPKKAELRIRIASSLPRLSADVTELRQVVLNLVVNAGEAIGDQPGAVSVEVATAELPAEKLPRSYLFEPLAPGRYVLITVSDTGMGMDDATRERVFEPFFTTKFPGRGLGLPAVLGIVRAHSGGIRIESQPGAGTTVVVYLPIAQELEETPQQITTPSPRDQQPSPPPPPLQAVPEPSPGGVVLVVDDEDAVRRVSQMMLTRLGYEVRTAADGREAVNLFTANPEAIRVVLLDLTMPRMDGTEVLAELRRLRPGIPVVLCSGYTEDAVPAELTRTEYTRFLQKPFTLVALDQAIRTVIAAAPV